MLISGQIAQTPRVLVLVAPAGGGEEQSTRNYEARPEEFECSTPWNISLPVRIQKETHGARRRNLTYEAPGGAWIPIGRGRIEAIRASRRRSCRRDFPREGARGGGASRGVTASACPVPWAGDFCKALMWRSAEDR
jgi:hypothetical protein